MQQARFLIYDEELRTNHSRRPVRLGVIGDLIIDEIINCHPVGMSQEEPSIVVTPVDSKKFLGGETSGVGGEVGGEVGVEGEDFFRFVPICISCLLCCI